MSILKLNRDAKQETSVCSRTTRLKNNQVKSRKRERQVQPHSAFNTLIESSETRSSHVRTSTGRPVAMCSHKRKSSWGSSVLQESYPEREDSFWASPNQRFLRTASSKEKKLLDCHSRLLLEEQKKHFLSETRSELNMQGLRIESADRALQETGLQLHSQRMELYQANHLSDHSKREKNWLCTEMDKKGKSSWRGSYEKSLGKVFVLKCAVQQLKERNNWG